MNLFRFSEFPIHTAGDLSDFPGEWDDKQVLAASPIRFTPATGARANVDSIFLYYRGVDTLISSGGVVQIGVMSTDAATFDGRNWDKHRSLNPVIPADVVGSLPVLGGDYNDMAVVEYDGSLRLFVNIYGNPSGSNRMVVFESDDGFTFTYLQEVQYGGTYFGCTCGPLWNVAGTLWGLFSMAALTGGGNDKRLRGSVDGGLTWTDYGRAVSVSGVDGQWDEHSLIVGRGFQTSTHVYAAISAMPYMGLDANDEPYNDWPEAVGLWRLAKSQLGTPDLLWEKYGRNPIMLRGPTEGGVWQPALIDFGGSLTGTYQTWAVPGDENINSTNMQTLRTLPYAGLSAGWSTKHIGGMTAGSTLALTNWYYDPFPPGNYAIAHASSGQYLCLNADNELYLSEKDPFLTFSLARQLEFYTLSHAGEGLRVTSSANYSGVTFGPDPGAADNASGQWLLEIVEDSLPHLPQLVAITNRASSLSLGVVQTVDRDGALVETRPFRLPDPDMTWVIVPVYSEGTATVDPDTETPISLPSGDLVGTTGVQTLTNKALEVLPRTSFVTRNTSGTFSSLANGQKVLTDSGIFVKAASANVVTDLAGWEPWVNFGIVDARAFFADEDSPNNQTAKFQAMVDWASALDQPVVLDCSGLTFRFGSGVVPQGATDVRILNGFYRPHETWTSQPHWTTPPSIVDWEDEAVEPDPVAMAPNALFDLASGVGQIYFHGCEFDGRPDSGAYNGLPVADFLAVRAGTNYFTKLTGRYYYNYGAYVSGGNAQKFWKCTFEQWKRTDAENQNHADRTGASYVVASGDCEVEFCYGGFAKAALVAIGTVGHMRGNHFYNGLPDDATGTATTNRQYTVICRDGAGLSMQKCQMDKGGIKFNGKVSAVFRDCEIHLDSNWDDQDLRFAVFEASEPNQKMKGMVLDDTLIIGKDGEFDIPFTSDRFFLDISSGGNSYALDDNPNVIVDGLIYRAGSKNVDQVPQMRGTRQYELRADAWTWDAGQGAYKTDLIDVSPSMFMPNLFPTEVVKWFLADIKGSGVSKPVGIIWATRSSTGVYRLWHNFAAVPTRMLFEASWDYRDTRKSTVGSNATVGSTHTQLVYSNGSAWVDVTGKPTTLSGYGITDATGLAGTQTVTGAKTFTGGLTVNDSVFTLQDETDTTKKAQFQLSGVSTGTTRLINIPNADGALVLTNGTTTLNGAITFANATNTFGSSTATGTTGLASGASISGSTKTVNIGTGGVSGSTTNISVGSAVSGALGNVTVNLPLILTGQSADPGSLSNGMVWHNSTTNKLKVRLNGTTSIVALSGESVAWSQITSAPTTLAGYGITDAMGLAGTQTVTGDKTFSGAVSVTDGNLSIKDGADATKVLQFEVSNLTTGTTRTLTVPDASGTILLTSQLEVPYLVPVAGDFIMTTLGTSQGGTGTLAGVTDRMEIFPFTPRVDLSIDQLVVNVTTLVASATGKIVLYSADANGRPDALITETGTLDFSTTGQKAASYSYTFRQGVTYWLGIRHSSTATLSTWTASATPDINGGTTVSTVARKVLRRSLAYATAAPSSWGFTSSEIQNANATAIWLRKA